MYTMFSKDDLTWHADGSAACYYKGKENLGLKIYKKDFNKPLIELEYLITKYVTNCGIKYSTKVLGLDSKNKIIYMQHIPGITFQNYIDEIMKQAPNHIISYDKRFDWVMSQKELQPFIGQHKYFIEELTNIGLTADDHCESFDNFIIDKNGILHVIDFSLEAQLASSELIHLVTIDG